MPLTDTHQITSSLDIISLTYLSTCQHPSVDPFAGVIIGKTLPLLFLPGVFPLKKFQNKTLPGVSTINFLSQIQNPPPSWENFPHRYCDMVLDCQEIVKIDFSSKVFKILLLVLHRDTMERL